MAKKKKKKKAKKGFGGVIVPVILTFAVLFSLGYIGKKSLMSGGVNSHLTLNSENEEAGGSGHITGPQSITVEEPRGADMQPQKTQEAVAQNNTQSKESKKTEKKRVVFISYSRYLCYNKKVKKERYFLKCFT